MSPEPPGPPKPGGRRRLSHLNAVRLLRFARLRVLRRNAPAGDVRRRARRTHARDSAQAVPGLAPRPAPARWVPSPALAVCTTWRPFPLMRTLGFAPAPLFTEAGGAFVLSSLGDTASAPVLITAPWSEPLDAVWKAAARPVLATDAAWCLSTNGRRVRSAGRSPRRGPRLRRVRSRRPRSKMTRRSLRCGACCGDESFDPPPLIERVSVASSRHAVGVCKSLRVGVLDAIGALLSGFAGALARKVDDGSVGAGSVSTNRR